MTQVYISKFSYGYSSVSDSVIDTVTDTGVSISELLTYVQYTFINIHVFNSMDNDTWLKIMNYCKICGSKMSAFVTTSWSVLLYDQNNNDNSIVTWTY